MSFSKDEALTKVGRRVQLCEVVHEDGDGEMRFYFRIEADTYVLLDLIPHPK